MSVLAYVRWEQGGTVDSYEGQVFGYAFDLMQSVESEVGAPNPMTFCVDEDGLMTDDEIDNIIDNLGDDEDDEEIVDKELSQRGEFFEKTKVLQALKSYAGFFQQHPGLSVGKAKGKHLSQDLRAMIAAVEGAPGRVRLYLS